MKIPPPTSQKIIKILGHFLNIKTLISYCNEFNFVILDFIYIYSFIFMWHFKMCIFVFMYFYVASLEGVKAILKYVLLYFNNRFQILVQVKYCLLKYF